MTDKRMVRYIWCFLTTLLLAFAAYNYLHRTGDMKGTIIGFGCVAIFWIMLTVMLVKQLYSTNKAKDGMIEAMANHYHVSPKRIYVVDRTAYVDPPYTKTMLKVNLVTLDSKVIKEH